MSNSADTDQASGVFLALHEVLGWGKGRMTQSLNYGSWYTAGKSQKLGISVNN